MRVTVPPTPEEQARAIREAAERAKPPYCVVTITVTLDGDRATSKNYGFSTLAEAQGSAQEGLKEVFEAALVRELELKLGLKDKAVTTWLAQPAPSETEQKRMLDDLREIALVDLDAKEPQS